ncbi:MAG: hypothetical protein Kow0092_34690 [Deferrisomatales bacterium]
MKTGDVVHMKGPLIDYEVSAPMCMSAFVGLYPWIMAARFGIVSENLGHDDGYRLTCSDGLVDFLVTFL